MNKRLKLSIMIAFALVMILMAAFFLYVSDYYRADTVANEVLQNNANTSMHDRFIMLVPETASDTAIIFYPGAKVEYTSYLPLLEKITKSSGVICILVKMPFHMAIFDANAADDIIGQYPEIKNWYMAGHSMGGAMASGYAAKHQNKVNGLILLGAYIYGDYPDENALTVYGSLNTSVAEKINYSQNIVVIEGGNHAQFGNYGKQKGDLDATISSKEQQNITVEAIGRFLEKR